MTFDRRLALVVPLAAAVLAGACGDYSNEDLEFMNALPQGSDVHAEIPPVSSALELTNEAELAQKTHDVTTNFNGLADTFVSLVDAVRSYPPTTRTPTSRTWGPFPADRAQMKNLDWQTRMIVSFDETVADQFDYEIDMHRDGNADTDWPTFMSGHFEAGHTARRGVGHVELDTAKVRAEGLDASDLGMLDDLVVDYATVADPITIDMTITDLADPASTNPAPVVVYHYSGFAGGQGKMVFDLLGNVIPGPATEDMRVTSQWLASGAGEAVLTVVSGDGVGSTQTECWGTDFAATYNSKPWAPLEQVPMPPPADPGALCPDISTP
jgi:hypothetical protein